MSDTDEKLRLALRNTGYDDAAINAVWPAWWSEEAAASPSAQAELRFTVARRLGLDARRLLESDEPSFVWRGESKFKHLRSRSDWEEEAISSFGIAIGQALNEGVINRAPVEGIDAAALRGEILAAGGAVDLQHLLAFCWAIGLPVAQQRIFPLERKRMSAMAANCGGRFAILVGREASYPATAAFYIAHELGHIANGHLSESRAIVDVDLTSTEGDRDDTEECDADKFALMLLTGMETPEVVADRENFNSAQLADAAVHAGRELQIEPGILALCCGHSTSRWPVAMAALRLIYGGKSDVGHTVNQLAANQLEWEIIPAASAEFLSLVLQIENERRR